MKRLVIAALFLASCGCATIFSSAGLEMASTLISLGGMGQTIVQMTVSGRKGFSVGPLPAQYAGNEDRLAREAWEQNFQLAKKLSWEGENSSWNELVASTARKSGNAAHVFALVEKRVLRDDSRPEAITVYRTVSGKMLLDPSESPGEAFYPETRIRNVSVPVFAYTAWFFTGSRQPSGILADERARAVPCPSPGGSGVLVRAVGRNTPAHTARLRAGDVITSVNGRAAGYESLFPLLRPGRNTMGICRDGRAGETELLLPEPGRR